MTMAATMIDRDDRLQSFCVTAKCTYQDFLDLTTGADNNLDIQRAIIKGTKSYATLRSDLKRGCVLPPLVLAANSTQPIPISQYYATSDFVGLSDSLTRLTANDVYIIDGLQRTNAIRQTAEELSGTERSDFLERELRLEIWLDISFGAIAYRMLLLNAGQRPMSVKHQVEILSSKLETDLIGIPGLDIFRTGSNRRRSQPGQFALAKLAQGFQAWLQGQPNIDLRNTVMEELLAESAIEVLGHSVADSTAGHVGGDGFHRFVKWVVDLDIALGVNKLQFLGNETVLLGIAAAVGALERSETLEPRVWPSLNSLLNNVSDRGYSALGLDTFDLLKTGIDSSKSNVGIATRDMVFSAFKEFIRGAAETPMDECWRVGAARD
jgi:hypothetical protein